MLDTAGSPTGLTFPREANRFTTAGTTSILWAGPDDWMIVDQRPTRLISSARCGRPSLATTLRSSTFPATASAFAFRAAARAT